MKCTKCGSQVEEEWVACPKCGLCSTSPPPEAVITRVLVKTIGGAIKIGKTMEEAEARKNKEFEEADVIRIERELVKEIEKFLLDMIDSYENEAREKQLEERRSR